MISRTWYYLKRIVYSWDLLLAVALTVAFALVTPTQLISSVAKDISATLVSLLAIIFSVFFAALAVIIAAGDNDFVAFVAEDGTYYEIIWSYKYTLVLLFVALMTSVFLFFYAVLLDAGQIYPFQVPTGWLVVGTSFLAFYALFATMNSALDSIKHAKYRARHIVATNGPNQDRTNKEEDGSVQ